jgi:hypothetical protein
MYVCMCVCMYVCMCVGKQHVTEVVDLSVYVCMYVCVCVRMYVCMSAARDLHG